MRLLSLTLNGQYKGLRDQTFSFDAAQGNIIAFIGNSDNKCDTHG